MTVQEVVSKAKKIVVKIGSNTLAKADGKINIDFMREFANQCASLMKEGKQIVLVSSGAQVAGVSTIDRWERKKDIHGEQLSQIVVFILGNFYSQKTILKTTTAH